MLTLLTWANSHTTLRCGSPWCFCNRSWSYTSWAVSYLWLYHTSHACRGNTEVIHIFLDDTFFSCCSFIGFTEIPSRPGCDGVVWNINATSAQLGHHWRQILGIYYLTGSETTSYMYGKGKLSALNSMRDGNFPGLYSALVELDATQAQLIDAG